MVPIHSMVKHLSNKHPEEELTSYHPLISQGFFVDILKDGSSFQGATSDVTIDALEVEKLFIEGSFR